VIRRFLRYRLNFPPFLHRRATCFGITRAGQACFKFLTCVANLCSDTVRSRQCNLGCSPYANGKLKYRTATDSGEGLDQCKRQKSGSCVLQSKACSPPYELANTAERNTGAGRVPDNAEDQGAPSLFGRGIGVLIKLVGVIQEIKTRVLSIAIKQPLKVGSSVSVEFGSEFRNGEIISCGRTGGTYEACFVMENREAADRRVEERLPVTQEVRILADSLGSKTNALVVNLSRQGMGLEIPTPLKLRDCRDRNRLERSIRHRAPLQGTARRELSRGRGGLSRRDQGACGVLTETDRARAIVPDHLSVQTDGRRFLPGSCE
jgi:hypothetical protein